MLISLFICHLYFGKIWSSLNKLDVEKIIELSNNKNSILITPFFLFSQILLSLADINTFRR